MKDIKEKTLFSIGKASKLCNVSQRSLRHYEKIGLIQPDRVNKDNGYRYYSYDTMRRIQTVRYLLDEGFSLAVTKDLMTGDDLDQFQSYFIRQIEKTQSDIEYYHQRLDSLKSWCSLVIEGKDVLKHNSVNVNARFVPEQRYFIFELTPEKEEENNDAYLETMYFTESKKDGHSMVDMGGAFNVLYESYEDRMNDMPQKKVLLQTMYPNSKSLEKTASFGGFMAVSCYHIGDVDSIPQTYRKMLNWAEKHHFILAGNCFERHVLDVYSTNDERKFVTELLLPTSDENEELAMLHSWK